MFIVSRILGSLMSLGCTLIAADTATTTSAVLNIHFIGGSPCLRPTAMRLLHDVNVETCPKYSADRVRERSCGIFSWLADMTDLEVIHAIDGQGIHAPPVGGSSIAVDR